MGDNANIPGQLVPVQRKLPDERHAFTHQFDIAGHEGYITVGLFEDGTPGEIFLVLAKEGSTISGFADMFAAAVSLALQYGVPQEKLVDRFSHVRFEPSGMTNNPDVRFAKSIVDYIFRWWAVKFLSSEGKAKMEQRAREAALAAIMPTAGVLTEDEPQHGGEAPACSTCGSIMEPSGSGHKCPSCGTFTP